MEIRTENWQGYTIRFVEHEGEWWAILKDICDALDLKTYKVAQRLDPDMQTKIPVERIDIPSEYSKSEGYSCETDKRGAKTIYMLAISELGIYEALFASRRPEAKQLRRWTATVLQRLRRHVGLEGFEAMRLTETEIQEDIDRFLDTIFYDEESKKLMMSVTVAGGDVEQIEFEDQNFFKG